MEIIEIGTDIIKTDRMKIFLKKKSLLNKVFRKKEILYSLKYKNPLPHLSVRFAAKESILKILKVAPLLYLKEIEIINDESGAPYIKFYGFIKKIVKKQKINYWKISLSHEKDFALAFVIGVKNDSFNK